MTDYHVRERLSKALFMSEIKPLANLLDLRIKVSSPARNILWTLLFLFLLEIGIASASSLSEIRGKVNLQVASKRKKSLNSTQRYGAGKKINPAPPVEAVVYLTGPTIEKHLPRKSDNSTKELPQEKFQFVKYVLPIQVGTKVLFPNLDKDFHNIFSYSKTKRFDLGRYTHNESPPSVVFDKPGEVRLFCEIHNHMRSTILILETPYFGLTDPEGNFTIEGIPPGKYTLHAWIDRKNVLEQPLELKPGLTEGIHLTKP